MPERQDQTPDSKYAADARVWLYSPDCPTGRIFCGCDAIDAAVTDGWVDSPGAVKARTAGGKGKAAGDDRK